MTFNDIDAKVCEFCQHSNVMPTHAIVSYENFRKLSYDRVYRTGDNQWGFTILTIVTCIGQLFVLPTRQELLPNVDSIIITDNPECYTVWKQLDEDFEKIILGDQHVDSNM